MNINSIVIKSRSVDSSISGETFSVDFVLHGAVAEVKKLKKQLEETAKNEDIKIIYLSFTHDTSLSGWYKISDASVEYRLASIGNTNAYLFGSLSLTRTGSHFQDKQLILATDQVTLANDFSELTGLPVLCLPYGATGYSGDGTNIQRTGTDGQLNLYKSYTKEYPAFELTEANMFKGQVHVWDTKGEASEDDWEEVFGGHHKFDDPEHCVIENSLVRIKYPAATQKGDHRLYFYKSTAWQECFDDNTYIGSYPTAEYDRVSILRITQEEAIVEFENNSHTTKFKKTITLKRGWLGYNVDIDVKCTTSIETRIGSNATAEKRGSTRTNVMFASAADGNGLYDFIAKTKDDYADTKIADMETDESWSAGAADTTNYREGAQGLKLSPTATNTVTSVLTQALDLSGYADTDYIDIYVYIDNITNCSQIALRFKVDAGNYYEEVVAAASLATGINHLHLLKSAFAATGTPTWATIATQEVEATASAAGTLNATFDDWYAIEKELRTSRTSSTDYEFQSFLGAAESQYTGDSSAEQIGLQSLIDVTGEVVVVDV